ncbi:MAG TPA: hypothetical protein VK210_08280 [Terriglobia bacterium]|nr:hypothetical protein [Terriglobia bacterium]
MKLTFVSALFLLVSTIPTLGQANKNAEALIVKNYKGLPVVVEDVNTSSVGITRDAIKNRAELRVRSAGLRPIEGDGTQWVYVRVNVVGAGFAINVSFRRKVFWYRLDGSITSDVGSVWETGTTGTTPNAGYVMETLDRVLDTFLNAYLKANQDSK